jgi:hypothetical protein
MTKVPRMDAFDRAVTVCDRNDEPCDGRCCGRHRVCIGLRMVKRERIYASTKSPKTVPKSTKSGGPLFFGSADGFGELFQFDDDQSPLSSILRVPWQTNPPASH